MFLGLDTSCYTTSLALLDGQGNLLADERIALKVKDESCGLRQSEMVFQHLRNLPLLFEKIFARGKVDLQGVGVSARPRSAGQSYMPAFVAGLSFAQTLSAVNAIKITPLSHQENHLEAGLWSAQGPKDRENFLALHLSGGTTDLLSVRQGEIKQIGGGLDLNAGQFIDRIGVSLGLAFPCGRELEKLARASGQTHELPVAVKGLELSFSGPYTAAKKLLAQGAGAADLAYAVQLCLAKSLAKLFKNATQVHNSPDILLVGGVAANGFIRDYLKKQLSGQGINLFFPAAVFCSDNAVGCAVKAWRNSR